jgi:protein-S-isoprenylcysteine O-methyltransferase Ste14
MSSLWLAVRSIVWAGLLPGLFAGYLPWRYFGLGEVRLDWGNPIHLAGILAIAVGIALLVACIWHFARIGRGTLSPVDPPRILVVRGPYRIVRNPMYVAVTSIVLGEVLLTRSTGLLIYWIIWFVAVNLLVLGYEEPTLRHQFGDSYDSYRASVGRWIPRWPRREPA